ncbi:Uncharacterized protein TCM_044648 [Theobroma cacao]|uniref:Uncharacterized protein n=1 Tax=Theobroma cacao TaxID=3641 RepID=A0A061FS84_THECC|nr:Uncharacterized protein TCM_044648 [Theobroma cacao]
MEKSNKLLCVINDILLGSLIYLKRKIIRNLYIFMYGLLSSYGAELVHKLASFVNNKRPAMKGTKVIRQASDHGSKPHISRAH